MGLHSLVSHFKTIQNSEDTQTNWSQEMGLHSLVSHFKTIQNSEDTQTNWSQEMGLHSLVSHFKTIQNSEDKQTGITKHNTLHLMNRLAAVNNILGILLDDPGFDIRQKYITESITWDYKFLTEWLMGNSRHFPDKNM